MRQQLSLITLLLFLSVGLKAQNGFAISGTVSDAETGETLPFANVFFAETTYGVNTDADGRFEIKVSEPGTYDLIIRFVGYKTYGLNIRLEDERSLYFDVALTPEEVNLGSVTVTAEKDENWKRYLQIFKDTFLGFSKNASQCKILNEDDLDFYYDRKENALYAYSKVPIKVENKALGYLIDYYLEEFKVDYSKRLNTYFGYTVFTEMEAKTKRRARVWEENRRKAYEGSLQHFFSSVFEGKLEEEGYIVQVAKDVTNFGRVLDPTNVNLREWLDQGQSDLSRQLPFDNFLYVTYTKERETPEYVQKAKPGGKLNSVSASRLGEQISWISLAEGKEAIEFERTGYVYDPLSFYSSGYWGFEKVADMVPINYKPKQ